jgi:hypothetical protein
MSLSVCTPYQYFNQLIGFHEIWFAGNAIQGDSDAVIFKSMASTILKWLRLKFVRWVMLARQWFGIVCIVALPWLHHIRSSADVTMITKAFYLLCDKNDITAVVLPWKPEIVVYCKDKKRPKVIAGFSYKGSVDIFEPFGRFS